MTVPAPRPPHEARYVFKLADRSPNVLRPNPNQTHPQNNPTKRHTRRHHRGGRGAGHYLQLSPVQVLHGFRGVQGLERERVRDPRNGGPGLLCRRPRRRQELPGAFEVGLSVCVWGGGVEGSGSELSMFCDLKRARTYTQTGHSVPGDERRGDSQDRGVKKSKLELASRSRPRIDRDSKFGVYGTPRKKHALNVVFELTCGLILQFTLPTERRVSMVLWGGHRVCA